MPLLEEHYNFRYNDGSKGRCCVYQWQMNAVGIPNIRINLFAESIL